jgi:clan AA aspartic protease (TIGR02281 family)
MPSLDRAAILLLSGTLALINVGCSQVNSLWSFNEQPEPVASVSPSTADDPADDPELVPTPISQPPLSAKDTYERGLDAAYSAASLGQSAQSPEDWQLVMSRWQEAIKVLKGVPSSSPYHAIAQSKIAEYQRNLGIAQQQASRPSGPSRTIVATAPGTVALPLTPSPTKTPGTPGAPTPSKTNTANPEGVIKVPIKRRAGQTPVIDVTFNGGQTFEMIIDTGASGTVITQAMAQSLGVVREGEVTANTASGKGIKFSTGKVESIAVEGIVAKDVRVAIGGPDLELGLLGQDFLGNYDVWIRKDVVEFHQR